MATPAHVERGILVFSIWAALGVLALGFVLEGFSRNSVPLSAVGITMIATAFVAHIIVNAVYQQGFTSGEAALGTGAYGLLALVFIFAWLRGSLSSANFVSGIALFGLLAGGFIAYLATRHGLRGTFSKFHVRADSAREDTR
jgi:hypothetical protein